MTRSRGALAILVLAIALAVGACTRGTPPLSAPPDQQSRAPTATAAASPSHGEVMLASPGTPYDATAILAAMRESRRPGGVPDQLETEELAAAIAELTWTWDGAAWESISVGAACGGTACSLDLAGTPTGGAGTDLYSFSIDPAVGSVELVSSDLHGHPASLEAELDAAARGALAEDRLDGLALVGARWLPPPDTDRYWLAYRSGGEEGAPLLDVLLDVSTGEVLEVSPGD